MQHLTHNITHTKHPTHKITHTTSPTRPLLAKGSDVRPGVVWAPGQISFQAQHFAACQGVGCAPWRRLASAGHRRRFRGRRSTLLLAQGPDVRPGVVWRRLGAGADFVAGAALCCLPRGRMYALASSGVGWAPAQISAGAALCCLPKGRMCALASSGVGWAPAQISWQAPHFAACQGVGCTPWRRLASAGHRRRFRQAQHFAGMNRGLIKVSRLYKCIYNILIYMV